MLEKDLPQNPISPLEDFQEPLKINQSFFQKYKKFLLKMGILFLVIWSFFLLKWLAFEPFLISGFSMDPTFSQNELVLVNKLTPVFQSLQRGNIIIFTNSSHPGKKLIKRVIGLPGEEVEIQNGHVYINSTLLSESYVIHLKIENKVGRYIPKGFFFVLGDNRKMSADSRQGWLVSKDKIIGVVFVRLLPLRKLSRF